MTVLNIDLLVDERLKQRAFSTLTFLAHAYIVGVPGHSKHLPIVPRSISIPWCALASSLGVKPIVGYMAVDLWNWFWIEEGGSNCLDNLGMIGTYTGCLDEAWFYLIPLGVEAAGAPCINALVECQKAISILQMGMQTDENENVSLVSSEVESLVRKYLGVAADAIEEMCKVLVRMYEKNDAHIFWNRVRPYSAGSKNNSNSAKGFFYQDIFDVNCDLHSKMNTSKEAKLLAV